MNFQRYNFQTMSTTKVKGLNRGGLLYPIYAVDTIGHDFIAVAGGGGASKTGVPNRIDVISVKTSTFDMFQSNLFFPLDSEVRLLLMLAFIRRNVVEQKRA